MTSSWTDNNMLPVGCRSRQTKTRRNEPAVVVARKKIKNLKDYHDNSGPLNLNMQVYGCFPTTTYCDSEALSGILSFASDTATRSRLEVKPCCSATHRSIEGAQQQGRRKLWIVQKASSLFSGTALQWTDSMLWNAHPVVKASSVKGSSVHPSGNSSTAGRIKRGLVTLDSQDGCDLHLT